MEISSEPEVAELSSEPEVAVLSSESEEAVDALLELEPQVAAATSEPAIILSEPLSATGSVDVEMLQQSMPSAISQIPITPNKGQLPAAAQNIRLPLNAMSILTSLTTAPAAPMKRGPRRYYLRRPAMEAAEVAEKEVIETKTWQYSDQTASASEPVSTAARPSIRTVSPVPIQANSLIHRPESVCRAWTLPQRAPEDSRVSRDAWEILFPTQPQTADYVPQKPTDLPSVSTDTGSPLIRSESASNFSTPLQFARMEDVSSGEGRIDAKTDTQPMSGIKLHAAASADLTPILASSLKRPRLQTFAYHHSRPHDIENQGKRVRFNLLPEENPLHSTSQAVLVAPELHTASGPHLSPLATLPQSPVLASGAHNIDTTSQSMQHEAAFTESIEVLTDHQPLVLPVQLPVATSTAVVRDTQTPTKRSLMGCPRSPATPHARKRPFKQIQQAALFASANAEVSPASSDCAQYSSDEDFEEMQLLSQYTRNCDARSKVKREKQSSCGVERTLAFVSSETKGVRAKIEGMEMEASPRWRNTHQPVGCLPLDWFDDDC